MIIFLITVQNCTSSTAKHAIACKLFTN